MATLIILIFEESFHPGFDKLHTAWNREQSSLKSYTFMLSFKLIFLFGVLNVERFFLLGGYVTGLLAVNESLVNKQIELFVSNLSCIADSSNYTIIHDIFSMDCHQVFTWFQKWVSKSFKIQYSEHLWRLHSGQPASAHDGSHFPLSKSFPL